MRRPRRSRIPEPPKRPSGYRQTRRVSSALRSAKRAEKRHQLQAAALRAWKRFKDVLLVAIQALGLLVAVVIVLLLIANTVNTFARWNATRQAGRGSSIEDRLEAQRDDVVFVAVENERAVGYLAMRIDMKNQQVFGIAIPEGAFVDIPGRGFERVGEAYSGGPDMVLATVSNFFGVAFRSYVAIPAEVYRQALTDQSVASLLDTVTGTNLTEPQKKALESTFSQVPPKNVALVPLPVKPIKLGDQTFFEPQRTEIADLLKSWWGVDPSKGEEVTRVIVYNGAGKAGLAGLAAQQLIRSGLRVIDTKNADSFDYETTRIVVKRGDRSRGDAVRKALGVGSVVVDTSTADVTDVIVVIGKDYRPPSAEKGDQ